MDIIRILKSLFHLNELVFEGYNKYEFIFRLSFPVKDGSYKETDQIRVTIPAPNKKLARKKTRNVC